MTDEKKNVGGSESGSKQKPDDSRDIHSDRTVGEILLDAREKSGQSLETLSLESRVPKKSLQYLETDNYEALPAKVYVQGFLRTYSQLLGLDVQQILSKYELQTGQTHTSRGDLWEVEETLVEEEVQSAHIFRRYLLPVVGAIVVLILIVWSIVKLVGGDVKVPEDMPGSGEKIESVADSVTIETEGAGSSEGLLEDKAGDGGEGEVVVDQDPDVGRSRQQEDVAPVEVASEPVSDQVAQAAMELRIIARPADTTWFDMVIYNTSGTETDSIFRDFILYPNQVERLTATGSFFFKTIGNAGGFWLEFDGKRLRSLGEQGEVVRNVMVTRAGIRLE